MKKHVIFLLIMGMLMCAASTLQAQTRSDERKNQKVLSKAEKDALNDLKSRAIKPARKEAKSLSKEGFNEFAGDLPMEMQLQDFWVLRRQKDAIGAPKYITAFGEGVAKTQGAAQLLAMEIARTTLASKIETNVNQIIEQKIAADQENTKNAESITKVVSGAKSYVVERLQYVQTGFVAFQELPGNQMKVRVNIYYNAEQAMEIARKALAAKAKVEMEEEADILIDEINRLLDR
ncbi:MAG: hypothetical protein AAFP00_01205 [Bacteroidota bacterium]